MRRARSTHRASALLLAALASCAREPEPAGPRFAAAPRDDTPVLTFAVYPLHNPARLLEAFQPLVEALNGRLRGARVALEASRDYAAFEAKVRARRPALLLANAWQTLEAMRLGYHVVATIGAREDSRGLLIARRESPLRHPRDLRRRSVAYPAPTSFASCLLPQMFLAEHGLDVRADVESRYVGSQDSAIMNAYLGFTAAAAAGPRAWRAFRRDNPAEAGELKVLWETEPLASGSAMIRDDVPDDVAGAVRALLLELEGSAEGRTLLAGMEIARFEPASDGDYEGVRRFVSRFEREVRRVEEP